MHRDFWSYLRRQWERFRKHSLKRRPKITAESYWQGYRIEAPLSYEEEQLPYQLLSTNFVWYWSSRWLREVTEVELATGLPVVRPFTRLGEGTVTEMVADLRARDASGDMRTIEWVGVEWEAARGWVDEQPLLESLRMFAREGQGPVQIVVSELGDAVYAEIFLPKHVPLPVQQVLSLFGLEFSLEKANVIRHNKNWDLTFEFPSSAH